MKQVPRVCAYCGKPTFTQYSHRNAPRVYCSRECRHAWQGDNLRKPRIERVCETCGKTFYVRPSAVKPGFARFCSMACKNGTPTLRPCAACGTIFRVTSMHVKHCSDACRKSSRTLVACQTCGKNFFTKPAKMNRYCSVRCYRAHAGESEPEAGARKCLEALGIEYKQEFAVTGWRYPVDFYIPSLNTMLEIDSVYWHQRVYDRAGADLRKTIMLQSRGYRVVRLPDTPFYGAVTDEMVAYLRAALDLANHAVSQQNMSSLYPIQLSLPLDKERML